MNHLVRVGVVLAALCACDRVHSVALGPTPAQSGAAPSAVGAEVFRDDFESDSLAQWQDGLDPDRHRIVTDPGRARGGSRYLSVTYPAGRDGGWLTRFFMPGYDALRVSLYVRFPRDWVGGTKIVGLYGSRTDDQWSAFGKAGKCPNGNDFFDAMLITQETGNPGPMKFYTYYPAMFRDNDGVTCWGRYGDRDMREVNYSPVSMSLSQDTWHRIDFEVRLNQPGQSDGYQRFWINGVLGAEWKGISFRESPILRLNAAQLSFSYGATGVAKTLHLDVDDVVVSQLAF
jgi:hypothetical protein